MNPKAVVAVTQLEYEKARAEFDRVEADGLVCVPAPSEEVALAAAVRQQKARHVICGPQRYRGELYEALLQGGVIARFGVGFDGIDLVWATKRGLLCTNTPGVLDESVAEHAIALMLAAARHVTVLDESTRRGAWMPKIGMELGGKRLAVIGVGPIGRRVAQMAAFGFGMTVIGYDVRPLDWETMKKTYGFHSLVKNFAEAVKDADVVSLHIPSTTTTRHFINRGSLQQMAGKAWLINVARGAIVDEAALFDALKNHLIAGAALDVFQTEPYRAGHPGKDLRTLPNVIMTPHVASNTVEANQRTARRALRNVLLAESGALDRMDLLNPREVSS